MTRKIFRKKLTDRLEAEGHKVRKPKLKGATRRTARFIRSIEGELIWANRYLKNAVDFYHDKKTRSIGNDTWA